MAAYFVVNCTIKDPDLLNEYLAGAGATLGIAPIKLLAMDNESETIEGQPAGERTVLLEFENKDDFRTWYHSEAYQAVIGKRHAATEGFAVLVNGFAS
jgi:uncharacterized protein (DUF1330 family)